MRPKYGSLAKREIARALRRRPTAAEAVAWQALRGRRMLGLKFRRQHPIAGFLVDFCCEQLKLVIEIDGDKHDRLNNRAADRERTTAIEGRGYRVIRIPNDQVSERRLSDILSAWLGAKDRRGTEIPPLP